MGIGINHLRINGSRWLLESCGLPIMMKHLLHVAIHTWTTLLGTFSVLLIIHSLIWAGQWQSNYFLQLVGLMSMKQSPKLLCSSWIFIAISWNFSVLSRYVVDIKLSGTSKLIRIFKGFLLSRFEGSLVVNSIVVSIWSC